MATAKLAAPMDHPIKGDRKMFTTSDDSALMKQVLATHAPDGREIDVKPILIIVEDILHFANVDGAITSAFEGAMEDESQLDAGTADMLEALSYIINKLSTEIAYRCSGGSDAHATTISLLNMLSSYPWDAKLVLTLAAFSLNYGDFWLLAQLYSQNRLAKSMAILRQIPGNLEYANVLKPRVDSLNNLTKSMLDLTSCVISFRELPSSYISSNVPAYSAITAAIPTVAYWIIRGVAAAAAIIANLNIGLGSEYGASTTEAWELASLAHKITTITDYVKKQLDTCHKLVVEKKQLETYEMLVQTFEMVHLDNWKILRSLIYAKDDQLPLFNGNTKTRVSLEVLRRKSVLLLISGLDISSKQLIVLEQIYADARARSGFNYEIVWIPIIDASVPFDYDMEERFVKIQAEMPWYTVYHPKLIEGAVTKFIKDKFHFKNEAIVVVLDPQGKMVNPNAFHMLCIWGSMGFPFTSERENALWKEESWRTEFIVDGIDQTTLEWIWKDRYIFLYGGDDIEWIRKFTSIARTVAKSANISLEMAYIGKISNTDQATRITKIITEESLSHCWEDLVLSWYFWTRLESMLFSKIKLEITTEDETIMREIKKLLSYGKSDKGWAMLCRGQNVAVTGHGPTVLAVLEQFDAWSENARSVGFADAFGEQYNKLHPHPCCRLDFTSTAPMIPETMTCPECGLRMEKFITFSCCHDLRR